MPPFAIGSTLTDLGTNLAQQLASENALSGDLARTEAAKLAALNALVGQMHTARQAREGGMERAALEAAVNAQRFQGEREDSAARIASAERIAAIPYGPAATKFQETTLGKQLETAKTLAEIQAGRLDPRLFGDLIGESLNTDKLMAQAEATAAQANLKAETEFRKLQSAKRSLFRTTLNPLRSDQDYEDDYVAAIASIATSFGEFGALIEPIRAPDGSFRFRAKQLPRIDIRQLQRGGTATGNSSVAVPPPVPPVVAAPPDWSTAQPAASIPVWNAPSNAMPTGVPQIPSVVAVPGVPSLAQEAASMSVQPLDIIVQSPFKELIPDAVFPDASARGGRRFGARTPEEQAQLLDQYTKNLMAEAQRLASMPRNRGTEQRAQLLGAELARIKRILGAR